MVFPCGTVDYYSTGACMAISGNLRTGYGVASGGSRALYIVLYKQSHDCDHCHRVAVQK